MAILPRCAVLFCFIRPDSEGSFWMNTLKKARTLRQKWRSKLSLRECAVALAPRREPFSIHGHVQKPRMRLRFHAPKRNCIEEIPVHLLGKIFQSQSSCCSKLCNFVRSACDYDFAGTAWRQSTSYPMILH
jgi:hypothetical protein